MAAASFAGTGNYSDGTKWTGGSGVGGIPTNADTCTINGDCTVDNTSAVASTITVASGGALRFSRSANSTLTVQTTVTVNSGGTWDQGTDSSPIPAAYTATLILNNALSTSGNIYFTGTSGFTSITFNGEESRKRWTTLTADATTSPMSVADSTGWASGDEVVFAQTGGSSGTATSQVETKTLNGATSWASGALANTHHSGGAVGNLYSNCIVKAANGTNRAVMRINLAANAVDVFSCRFTKFIDMGAATNQCGVEFNATVATSAAQYVARRVKSFYGNVFTQSTSNASWTAVGGNSGSISQEYSYTFDNCIFYAPTTEQGNVLSGLGGTVVSNSLCIVGQGVFGNKGMLSTFNDNHINMTGGLIGLGTTKVLLNRNIVYGKMQAFANTGASGNAVADMSGNDFGVALTLLQRFTDGFLRNAGYACVWDILSTNDKYNTAFGTFLPEANFVDQIAASSATFLNKNNDVTQQEIITGNGKIIRNNSTTKRGTSSLSLKPLRVGTNLNYDIPVPVVSGEVVEVAGYLQYDSSFYNSGTWTAPTAKLLDTDGTTVLATFTPASASSGTWLPFIITGTASSGGNCTIRLTANPSSVITGTVLFDGVASSPFIVKARHFGFTFDETNPKRTRNTAVTTSGYTTGALASDESTAAGITGIAVTGATSAIVISASKTFQNLYDYTQAWSCTNLTHHSPVTGVGSVGSVSLTALGDVTINDGFTLSGGGSLAIASGKTLSTEFSSGSNYTYTNGVWAQTASTPSFAGGTLNIGAAGVYVFYTTGTVIINMTPTGASPPNYDLDSITANGVVDLRNTTAHAITVELSTAVAALAITSNNTGGTITITAPVVTADISITGMANTVGANNRLQIINSTAAAAASRANSTAYTAGDVRLRQTGAGSENTAGLYLRCTTSGTSAASPPTWNTTVGGTTTDGTAVWTTYAILYYDADPAATSLTDTYIDGEEFKAGETVEIRFAEEDPAVSFKTYSTSVVATANGFSALVNETDDSSYATYATSGVTQDSIFSPNFVANYIVLDTDTNFTGSGAYAYYCYLLTTSEGMYRFWGGLTGIDPGNIRNNVDVVSLYFDCSSGFVRQTDDIRIFRSDLTRPALDPVTAAGGGIEINWKVPVNVVSTGGSALTPTESAQLMALPSASITASAVGARTVEGTYSEDEILRLIAAALAGSRAGIGTATETYTGLDGVTPRVVFNPDANGNGTPVLDAT